MSLAQSVSLYGLVAFKTKLDVNSNEVVILRLGNNSVMGV